MFTFDVPERPKYIHIDIQYAFMHTRRGMFLFKLEIFEIHFFDVLLCDMTEGI